MGRGHGGGRGQDGSGHSGVGAMMGRGHGGVGIQTCVYTEKSILADEPWALGHLPTKHHGPVIVTVNTLVVFTHPLYHIRYFHVSLILTCDLLTTIGQRVLITVTHSFVLSVMLHIFVMYNTLAARARRGCACRY